jgi:hypothetical protein
MTVQVPNLALSHEKDNSAERKKVDIPAMIAEGCFGSSKDDSKKHREPLPIYSLYGATQFYLSCF